MSGPERYALFSFVDERPGGGGWDDFVSAHASWATAMASARPYCHGWVDQVVNLDGCFVVAERGWWTGELWVPEGWQRCGGRWVWVESQ